MKPILSAPITFAASFLFITFLLQWWIRPSYPAALWLLLFLCIFCFLFFFFFTHHTHRTHNTHLNFTSRNPLSLLSCVLGISLALWNVARTERALLDSLKHIPWDTNVQIEGMIKGLPKSRQGTITYTIAVHTVIKEQERHPVQGNITVRTRDITSPFTHGDIVHIAGSIEHIPPPYDTYFRAQSIVGSVPQAVVTGAGRRGGSSILRTLARWNIRMTKRIRDLVPEPEASLLAGLLLGETGGFSKETLAAFRVAGLTHILAISGYNITLLLIALSTLTAKIPSPLRMSTAVISIALFTLFVGGSPSAIRAAMMGSLGLLALHSRHLPDTRRTMLLAAFLMLLWNPMQLWWDASFQLSFLAVIGITEFQPILKKLLKHLPEELGIREALTVTLAAQCTALPWAAALFGNVPIFSPIANVLVAPAIPFIMITGAGALLGGTVHDLVGRILAFPCWIALQWIIRIAETLALLPLASLPFPKNAGLPLFLYYSTLLIFLLQKKKSHIRDSLYRIKQNISYSEL